MSLYLDPVEKLELTSSLFGKILVLVWAAEHGRSQLPDTETLTRLLLEGGGIPEEIKKIMHLDNVTTGYSILEMTDYIYGAQKAGLLSRRNPCYVAGTVQIGAYDAQKLLNEYKEEFPAVVTWLKERVASYRSKEVANQG